MQAMQKTSPRTGDVVFVKSLKPIETFQRVFREARRPDLTHAAVLADDFTLMEAQFARVADFLFLPDWKRNRKEGELAFVVLRHPLCLDRDVQEKVANACLYFDEAEYAAIEVILNRPTTESRAVCSGLVAKVISRAGLCDLSDLMMSGEPTPSVLFDRLLERGFVEVDTSGYWNFDFLIADGLKDHVRTASNIVFTLDRGTRKSQLLMKEFEKTLASALSSSLGDIESLTSEYGVIVAYYISITSSHKMSGLHYIQHLLSLTQKQSSSYELGTREHFSDEIIKAELKGYQQHSVDLLTKLRTTILEKTTACVQNEIRRNLSAQQQTVSSVRAKQSHELRTVLRALASTYSQSALLLMLLADGAILVSELPTPKEVLDGQFVAARFRDEAEIAANLSLDIMAQNLFNEVKALQVGLYKSATLLASALGPRTLQTLNEKTRERHKELIAIV